MLLRLFNVEREVTDEAKIREMKRNGWYVVRDEKAEIKVVVDFSSMSKADLVYEAKLRGIDTKQKTKAELIMALSGEGR